MSEPKPAISARARSTWLVATPSDDATAVRVAHDLSSPLASVIGYTPSNSWSSVTG